MANSVYRTTVFILYQFSLLVGIALLPVGLVAEKIGIPFPLGKMLERIEAVYERAMRQ